MRDVSRAQNNERKTADVVESDVEGIRRADKVERSHFCLLYLRRGVAETGTDVLFQGSSRRKRLRDGHRK